MPNTIQNVVYEKLQAMETKVAHLMTHNRTYKHSFSFSHNKRIIFIYQMLAHRSHASSNL